MTELWSDLGAILTAPFQGELDFEHLLLLIGLVLVLIFLWIFLLGHIRLSESAEVV